MSKNSSLSISIPEPCKESWDEMTAADKGRICKKCQYEVVDYSLYTDVQLLQKLSGKNIKCGRFNSSQLDRVFEINTSGIQYIGPSYKRIAAAIAITTATIIGSGVNLNAQTIHGKPTEQVERVIQGEISSHKVVDSITISGIITDNLTSEAIYDVIIIINNSSTKFRTDKTGKFKINVEKNSTIRFVYHNYQDFVIKVKDKNMFDQEIKMKMANQMIMGIFFDDRTYNKELIEKLKEKQTK